MVQTATEDVKQNRALQLRVSQLQVQVDHLKVRPSQRVRGSVRSCLTARHFCARTAPPRAPGPHALLAQIDNSRLVRLLSTTAEYQEFRHFFRDSGGAATYMHSRAFARSALPQPARSPARSRSASPARGASSAAPGGGAGPGTARLAASALSVRDLEEGHGARAADGEAGEEEVEAVHWEELPAFMEAYPPLEGDHPVSARCVRACAAPRGAPCASVHHTEPAAGRRWTIGCRWARRSSRTNSAPSTCRTCRPSCSVRPCVRALCGRAGG